MSYQFQRGRVESVVLSLKYKMFPIPSGGSEIIIRARLTMADEKTTKKLIKENYEPVTNLRRIDYGENCLNIMEQHSKERHKDHVEVGQVIFID